MEGLIPMVFRSIQRSKTRRHYEYLSSSSGIAAAATATATAEEEENATPQQRYNIADFYTNGEYVNRDGDFNPQIDKINHRRHKSFQVDSKGFGYGFGLSPEYQNSSQQQQSKKLVRFRSHRLFSCVTGAP